MADATDSVTEPASTDNSNTSTTESQESQASRFDPTPYADQLVSVQVDGQEELVPLGEAIKGYMRQAHFTKASQTLASQREEADFGLAVAEALENDPAKAIKYFSDVYGVKINLADEESTSEKNPEDERLRSIETRLDSNESREALRAAREEFASLSERYGSDLGIEFEPLLEIAAKEGYPSLDAAFRSIAFQKEHERKTEDRAKQDAEARDGKKNQSATAHGSSAASSSESVSSEAERKPGESSRDALRRSLKNALRDSGATLPS